MEIINSEHNTSSSLTDEQPRIIRLTEISAKNFPTQSDYKYKCHLHLTSDSGQLLLQKELFTRQQPNWLLDLKSEEDCTIAITLSVREGDISQLWQDVGTVTFATDQVLNGQSSTEVELPLTTWSLAPQLKLQTRLTQNAHDSNNTLNLMPVRSNRQAGSHLKSQQATESVVGEIPEAVTLLPQEEVIVKDVWNKVRSFKELCMELFFERLLLEAPELTDVFGDAIDGMRDHFYELFDCCVRQLQPHTEYGVRESLVGVPPVRNDAYNTVEDYTALFADIGMRLPHWLIARRVWMWMLPSIPYLEEYDRENLGKGSNSAFYRFFNGNVILPMVEAIRCYEAVHNPEMLNRMWQSWQVFSQNKQLMGFEFYQILFERYPQVLPLFGRANVDYLSLHLFQALDFLVQTLRNGDVFLPEIRELGRLHRGFGVPPSAYGAIADVMFSLFEKHVPDFTPELRHAWQTLFDRVANVMKQPKLNEKQLLGKARQYLETIAKEQAWEPADYDRRWAEVEQEVKATGTYTHTYEELAYGAQLAWRNAPQCIGRIQWNNMIVRDRRHVTDPDEMFQEVLEHLRMGTNGGNLQIVMTVFRPKQPMERWGPRFWNPQYVRYAAYELEDGTIMGDGANLDLTKTIMQEMGWKPPEPRTPYDILPLVIEVPGMEPKLYEIPREEVLEVEIEHPTVAEFASLGLRWYAIPAISGFRLDIGGITYGCCPFNGWYMDTEIVRDFFEENRYNKAEDIAHVFKLDTSTEHTLWRDRAFLELNIAVLHSFQKARVTMVDHQTASKQFLAHDLREKKQGRECPANWGWVVPAAGGSSCPVWHHDMREFYLDPHYHHAADKWFVQSNLKVEEVTSQTAVEDGDRSERILVLYGSETGTAEGFARQVARKLKRYRPIVMAMDEYNTENLSSEQLLLVVTSTFGNGEMPGNGKRFLQWLKRQPANSLHSLNYSIMALGSTVYEHFCAAGVTLDKTLAKTGANRIVPLHKGDQIKGQADTFKQWLGLVARVLGEDATSADAANAQTATLQIAFLDTDTVTATTAADFHTRGVEVPVVANRELLREVIPGSRSTRYIAFDISGTDISYETGDHVTVYPCNPTELCDRLCQRLSVSPNACFTASYVGFDGVELDEPLPFAVPTTVRQVLSEELDLSLREPFDELFAFMYNAAQDPAEKQRLEKWLNILKQNDASDIAALKKTITDNYMSVADLLDEFPSVIITLEALIELLPKPKPRLYSISSSSLVHPDQIEITVGVVQVRTDAGKTRQGLCSNYLAGLSPQAGAKARIAVHTSNFRPPTDPDAVTLMVGPGTGVSPLIAFLQHREALLQQGNGTSLGEACLYFGCRNYNDYLYQEQLAAWQSQGVFSQVEVAFSRLTDQKVYVQHLIKNQSHQIWKLLSHPKCHYYVCGDAKMADDVFEELIAIACKEGGLSHIEAVDFFDRMKAQNRFSTDVWGVTLHFKQAIKEVQKDKYSMAERWLERVQQATGV